MSQDENQKRAADLMAKLEEIVSKASESQVRADSEALRANQAKMAVEEHSNTVAKLKGAIEADASAIAAKKAELEKQIQAIINLRQSSESDATNIANIRKTADETGKAISETSGKAAAVQAHLEETKKSVDVFSKNVGDAAKNAEAEIAKISATKKTSEDLFQIMQKTNVATAEIHERAKTSENAIDILAKESKTNFESLNNLLQKIQEMSRSVANYEADLLKMKTNFSETLQKVENLLPGATSAGLASSFCAQKTRFKKPQIAWMSSFILCIIGLLTIAAVGTFNHVTSSDTNWDSILRDLVQRLPFVVPLVWLGIVSGRQYMTALRMEEEYAFKEATSTAFEGYKQQMITVPENANGGGKPINTLCENVLSSLSRRPGLIYEGKHHDVTPLTPAVEAVEKLGNVIVEGLKQAKDISVKPVADATENISKFLPKN